jgi:hypothetical protein
MAQAKLLALVVPAKAGTQANRSVTSPWIPACAGMTMVLGGAAVR